MSTEVKKKDISSVLKATTTCALSLYLMFFLADILNLSPNIVDRMGGSFLLIFNCILFQFPLSLFYIIILAIIEKSFALQGNWHKWWYYPILCPIPILFLSSIGRIFGH